VKRPATDASLPNVWGLPAVVVKAGELPEDAVRRLGVEKLSTEIEPQSYIGIKRMERDTQELILMDIVATLHGGEPSVETATTTGTKYIDQQWTGDYSIFTEAAQKGSLCTRIFLESKGMSWE
jgi:ADP-ribose pyrophosphatase YjhB (NUDIX family)